MLSLVRIRLEDDHLPPRIVTYDDEPPPKCKMFYSLRSLMIAAILLPVLVAAYWEWQHARAEHAIVPLVLGAIVLYREGKAQATPMKYSLRSLMMEKA